MYDVSIQELNNLIGELDSFQREHEMKMRKQNENNVTTAAHATILPSIEISDIYSNLDRLSICSNEPNPIMCSTQSVHSSEMTFNSDSVDGPSVKNLSCGDHDNHSNKSDISNVSNGSSIGGSHGGGGGGGSIARNIELIPDSYNVSDNYVKEHTEIVVLRRKDSLSELNSPVSEKSVSIGSNGTGKEPLERISSFRCSSFSKPDRDSSSSFGRTNGTPLNRPQSNSGKNESVIFASDECSTPKSVSAPTSDTFNGQHMNDAHIRSKPLVTPRPASLSGLLQNIQTFSFSIFFSREKHKIHFFFNRNIQITYTHHIHAPFILLLISFYIYIYFTIKCYCLFYFD